MREWGSEFDLDANLPFLTEEGSCSHPLNDGTALRYRSGRDALKAVARSLSDKCRKVLLPALCCESMVSPFLMNGYRVEFYGLGSDYTALLSDLESKLESGTVLLYLSYFGVPPFSDAEGEALRRSHDGVVFVEDRTHDPLHRRPAGRFAPDVTVISIRKWIAIPDGGLLWSRVPMESANEMDGEFSRLRRRAMGQKSEYLATGEESLKASFRAMLGEAAERLDLRAEPYGMTEESAALLRRLDFDAILRARKRNARVLKEALASAEADGVLSFIGADPEASTLYFPLLLSDRDGVQSSLAREGIYCPVIWPLPEGAEGVCPVASDTAERMLAIPCDQRYGEEDMRHIAEALLRCLY